MNFVFSDGLQELRGCLENVLIIGKKKERHKYMQKKILVVEDQPGIRLLLTDILEGEGYGVTTAATGKEAFNEIGKTTFDLLILDYKLPVLTGVEVLNKLEREHIYIPAILMSGMVEEMRPEEKTHSLIRGVLAKPFDVKAISDMVRLSLN
jgi:two-component system response regulator (stage 0 sporulation protein F)